MNIVLKKSLNDSINNSKKQLYYDKTNDFNNINYNKNNNNNNKSMNSKYGFNKEVLFKYDQEVLANI